MPDGKNNTKLTGDTHLPEVAEELPQANQDVSKQPPQGGGEIKDKEAETSDSYGKTRDSGERPK